MELKIDHVHQDLIDRITNKVSEKRKENNKEYIALRTNTIQCSKNIVDYFKYLPKTLFLITIEDIENKEYYISLDVNEEGVAVQCSDSSVYTPRANIIDCRVDGAYTCFITDDTYKKLSIIDDNKEKILFQIAKEYGCLK